MQQTKGFLFLVVLLTTGTVLPAQGTGGDEGAVREVVESAVEVTHDIASVKVVEDYPGSRYTDYLSLVRFDGKWWIVNKIYTSERR